MRLDVYLTENCNIQSRNKAYELIKAKKIKVNGHIVTKPSFQLEISDDKSDIKIEILEDKFYVSRSAYKLKYFLDELNDYKLENKIALDIGSSTGGFTQILLENNVKQVTCVDVGSNQLHNDLKNDDRIIICENTDIRIFKSDILYDIITCDVSFISLHCILDDINRLASQDIIILFKPQFEVGREVKRDRAGVVKDKNAVRKARKRFIARTFALNWELIHSNESELAGKNGNSEELFYFKHNSK